jgi:tripartite-type tricarboxylate transporter receptor subunit TctC
MMHVPYRGAAPALTDLLGGQVQVYFATTPASVEYISAAGCARWRWPAQRAGKDCRTFRR